MITDEKADLDLKQALTDFHSVILGTFLDSNMRLAWADRRTPRVSIILVLFNRVEMTLQCLRSLHELSLPVEIIAVDNASTDDTSLLLDRLEGIKILRLRENRGFAPAVNAAARSARGEHILILDNGAELLPGTLEAAVRTLESAGDIGAVAGKLIFPEGRLEQAGGFILRDGSCQSYGRGDSPWAPPYMHRRDVDYGSRAFLLTDRELFIDLHGFDEDYGPGNYQAADYCLRLWKSGKRVVFDPTAVVVHFAVASPQTSNDPNLLAQKHADWLTTKQSWRDLRVLEARSLPKPGQRVLILDDRVPHFRHGAGFPRTCELVRTLDESGHFVTFYPVTVPEEDWSEVYEDIPQTVEVMVGYGEARLTQFLQERDDFYSHIIVSRPHNMKTFRSKLWRDGGWATKARVIYDAEAIFTLREAEQRRMSGEEVTESAVARLLAAEMKLAEGVHSVFSVTDRERDCFLAAGVGTVWTLGHTVAVKPTPRSFQARAGFLFVGALSGAPNRDAVLWFSREIWPKVRSRVNAEISFSVVGSEPTDEIRALPDIQVLGPVTDLIPYYDRSRIFVAPSRLAAGIPIKVQTAAAHGLPVVCTSILAEELGWQNGVELLVADDPGEFAECCIRLHSDAGLWQRLRTNALERVSRECSPESFASTLALALAAHF